MTFFSEYYFLFKKLNANKVLNLTKLVFSFLISILTQKTYHKGNPYAISVEPTNQCNLKCPQCPTGMGSLTRAKGKMLPELFQKIIDETHKDLIVLNFFLQGEPFLSKHLFENIRYASQNKLYTICSTNGHYLSEINCRSLIHSGLDKLIVSLDGTTQEVYAKYRRNGDLETLINGIKQLQQLKKELQSAKPFVELQFLVFRFNEHQINNFKTIAQNLKVEKYSIKTAQIYDFRNYTEWLPSQSKHSRYTINNSVLRLKSKLSNHCFRMWTSAVITWDGKMLPCCFDKNADFALGNIQAETFASIWKSDKYNIFRKKILTERKSLEMCSNCNQKF